jgi:hypothetical protein
MRKKHSKSQKKTSQLIIVKEKFASEGDIYILIYDIHDDIVHQIVSRLDNDDDDQSSFSLIFDKHLSTCVYICLSMIITIIMITVFNLLRDSSLSPIFFFSFLHDTNEGLSTTLRFVDNVCLHLIAFCM